jgi:hypothetical protein
MTLAAKAAASAVALALFTPLVAHAQADPTLTAAYNALSNGQYGSAVKYSAQYLASNPHRYDADFIHAAGQCGLHPGSASAVAEMTAVRDGYDLTPAAASQIAAWLAQCQKAPVKYTPPQSDGDVGSSTSALTAPPKPPAASSAAPGAAQPKARLHMGAFVPATSYSGDDYDHGPAGSPVQCSQRCLAQAPCRSMTYDSFAKICWLKRSVPPALHGANFVSAVKVIPWAASGMAIQH